MKTLLLALLLIPMMSFGQNKKKQIEALNFSLDSLNSVLEEKINESSKLSNDLWDLCHDIENRLKPKIETQKQLIETYESNEKLLKFKIDSLSIITNFEKETNISVLKYIYDSEIGDGSNDDVIYLNDEDLYEVLNNSPFIETEGYELCDGAEVVCFIMELFMQPCGGVGETEQLIHLPTNTLIIYSHYPGDWESSPKEEVSLFSIKKNSLNNKFYITEHIVQFQLSNMRLYIDEYIGVNNSFWLFGRENSICSGIDDDYTSYIIKEKKGKLSYLSSNSSPESVMHTLFDVANTQEFNKLKKTNLYREFRTR
ncbi:MAG: hypothetical protein CL844_02110 [Crocinitomicaceae bacterium]|nr:hypothetical protein [Crocinitomicaceae bacterium]|tara:strand:- start:879 stop:1814 length:936 start_codon:yes stop_codon:yes gene_type:complete